MRIATIVRARVSCSWQTRLAPSATPSSRTSPPSQRESGRELLHRIRRKGDPAERAVHRSIREPARAPSPPAWSASNHQRGLLVWRLPTRGASEKSPSTPREGVVIEWAAEERHHEVLWCNPWWADVLRLFALRQLALVVAEPWISCACDTGANSARWQIQIRQHQIVDCSRMPRTKTAASAPLPRQVSTLYSVQHRILGKRLWGQPEPAACARVRKRTSRPALPHWRGMLRPRWVPWWILRKRTHWSTRV